MERVRPPDGEPARGSCEAGEEKCAGERLDRCAVAVCPRRDPEDGEPVGDIERGVEPQLALHRGVRRILARDRPCTRSHGVKTGHGCDRATYTEHRSQGGSADRRIKHWIIVSRGDWI